MDLRPIFALAIIGLGVFVAVKRELDQKKKRNAAASSQPVANTPAEEAKPVFTDVAIKAGEPGGTASYDLMSCPTSSIMWVSRETAADGNPLRIRKPKPETAEYTQPLPFKAAGKTYISVAQLEAEKLSDGTCRDCYGRVVLCASQRFPCFDSYDFDTEDRYYRWWLIVEEGCVTRVYRTDGQKKIFVTNDAAELENICIGKLKAHGYVL